MLTVDLAHFSDDELAGAVAERCAPLGTVNRVTVYAARAGTPGRPFAIVAMDTRAAAESVSAAFSGRTVGSAVVIFLEQTVETGRPLAPVEGSTRVAGSNVVALGNPGHH